MSGLAALLGWYFLPNLATNWVQTIYYGITIRAGDPKPQPGSPRYAKHRRRIHILVVSAYLLYTIYEAHWELQRAGSFYSDLSLARNATEREVKSRFRRLAALYHPDKVSSSASAEDANTYFIRLKTASETLTDPARRFAYDRFGPETVSWQRCVTIRDFVVQGLQQLVPSYVIAALFMVFVDWMGYLEWGRAWRWMNFLAMFLFEVNVLTRPTPPALFERVINPALALLPSSWSSMTSPYLSFQAISLARKVSATLQVALSRIGPMLFEESDMAKPGTGGSPEARLLQTLEVLERTAKGVDDAADNLLNMELAPFTSERETLDDMRAKIKDYLVQNTIRADPMVKDAMVKSLRRRRHAPHGARGTK